uniref:protein-disulfide reductase n=1 Tax=Ananas comosus var. bracteatus TaxID=296719 RepID=A0A6V7P993_ANACO|nr:unnamed protein product [Ananas comosus var. bracteatus]
MLTASTNGEHPPSIQPCPHPLVVSLHPKKKEEENTRERKAGKSISKHPWRKPTATLVVWTVPPFHPKLVEVYNELSSKGGKFEVVFISSDEDEDSFSTYFSNMPWLAIPFSDSQTRDNLSDLFDVVGIPCLVILDENGRILTNKGVSIVKDYGSEAYPFTPERMEKMKEEEEYARENQTLQRVLVSSSRDFVISNNGNKVPVAELEGKIVGLYFSISSFGSRREFTLQLAEMYKKLQEKGESFEVVLISLDDDKSSYDQGLSAMPWLAVPFKDRIIDRLVRYFELETVPTLVIIGSDGRPFMPMLRSLWKRPELFRRLLFKDAVVSSSFGDERKKSLSRTFKIYGIPSLVAIGPTGKTITKEAKELVSIHGANAYPFTKERIEELEEQIQEMAKGWPEKLKHSLHEEHELVVTRRAAYVCDACEEEGTWWSFYCDKCDFDLHPKCALNEDGAKEGYVCDGDVCYKP